MVPSLNGLADRIKSPTIPTLVLLPALVFLLDMGTALDKAVWTLHVIPLLLTLRVAHPRLPLLLAAVSTALVIVAGVFSPSGISPAIILLNRALAISVIWAAAWLIMQRQAVMADLSASRARLVGILDNALDAVIGIDEAGIITDWNARSERIFGWTSREAVGRDMAETIIPPRYRQAHKRGLREFLATGQGAALNRRIETTALRRDGTEFPVELSIVPLQCGATHRFSAFVADISARKRAEQENIKIAQDRLLLLESTGEGIFGVDSQACCTFINKAGAAMLGYRPDELLGRNIHELAHHTRPDGTPYPIEHCPIVRAFRTGQPCRLDNEILWRRDGTSFSAEYAAHPIVEHLGIIGAVVTFNDITVRKRADRAFRSLLEGTAGAIGDQFFHSLVQQLAAALDARYALVGEFVGETHTRVRTIAVWGGAAFLDNFEYSISGAPCEGVLDSDQWFYPRQVCVRFPSAGLLQTMGVESYIGTRLCDAAGRVLGLLVVMHTAPMAEDKFSSSLLKIFGARAAAELERKRTEEALRASEERLRQAQKMEAVGQLAGGIAHDFNNLLMVMNGYNEILLRELGPESPLHHTLVESGKAGERAAALTRQLLAFSRRQLIEPQVIDLSESVTSMRTMLTRLIGEHIELVTVLAPEQGCVKADPGQIEQVIMNLAVNARDAMPQGGTLTIATANVELDHALAGMLDVAQPGAYVRLTVSDTGHGMDAETRAHIFEPFFTTKQQGKGTGLGLASTYGIVKQNGGAIVVESEPGRGATFSIYLPRVEAAAVSLRAPAPAGLPAGGQETILLVEDEEAVRALVRRSLQKAGYGVLDARHGTEALTLGSQFRGPIHLLLTDVVMPHMTGRELADHLIRTHPDMKVLYMTGYTDDVILQQGGLGQDVSVIHKPVLPDTLLRKVRDLLDVPERSC